MADSMIERMKIALRPLLHHGLEAYPDVETEAAHRVLAATREPTEAMEDAGGAAMLETPPDATSTEAAIWQAMIDAALAEGGR